MPKDERYDIVLKGLADLRERGIKVVDVERLERWVATIPAPADDSRAFEEWKTRAPLEYAGKLEASKWALDAGQTALKTLLAMNGGAAVALLAYLGNAIGKGTWVRVDPVGQAMLTFVCSVGLVGVSSGARYFTQVVGATGNVKAALRFNYVAVGAGLLSLLGFFVGGWLSYLALT